MKKLVAHVISLFLFVSLACQTTQTSPTIITTPSNQVDVVPTSTMTNQDADIIRSQIIIDKQPLFLDNNYWKDVPFGCVNSMTSVLFSGMNPQTANQVGSATLVYAEIANNQNGMTSWVYWLITAKHVYTNTDGELNGDTTIYAGRDKKEHTLKPFAFYEIMGIKTGLDIGVVALIDQDNKFNILTPSFFPISVEKFQSGNNLPIGDNPIYYTVDYPAASNYQAQYTTSTIERNIKHENGVQIINKYTANSSVTSIGSSGGPLCNQAGQVVGIHTLNMPNDPHQSITEANPDNIQSQVLQAIQDSRDKLKLLGYIY